MNIIIYSVLLSFLIAAVIGLMLIPVLKSLKLGQNIREDGPKSHSQKAGTPTFGGIIFILASIITLFIMTKQSNKETMLIVYSSLVFGFVGFLDDALKKFRKKNEGLTSKQKLLLLIAASTGFSVYLYFFSSIGSSILIPFTGKMFDLKILYLPFTIFFYTACSNSVNLTDGLDGLAASVTLLVMVFFSLVSFSMGHYSLAIYCGALSGALLGFLRFNSYPAKIIMGDTGALALGGIIGTAALILKNPLIVIIVGGIYILETLSDIIQIISYRAFGKRVFKMAPFHHALELSGWHEAKIVSVFSIVTALLCLIAFLSY